MDATSQLHASAALPLPPCEGKSYGYAVNRMLAGSQSRIGNLGEQQNVSACRTV
jgi:hypothetical protein